MGRDPPDFLDQGPPNQQPKSNTTPGPKKKDVEAEEAFMREQEVAFQQQEFETQRGFQEQQELQKRQYEAEIARQQQEREVILQRRQQEALVQQQQEALVHQQQQQRQVQQQQQQQQFLEMQNVNQQLEWYRKQNACDRELVSQYESRVHQLTNEMGMLRMNAEAGLNSKDLESIS